MLNWTISWSCRCGSTYHCAGVLLLHVVSNDRLSRGVHRPCVCRGGGGGGFMRRESRQSRKFTVVLGGSCDMSILAGVVLPKKLRGLPRGVH